MIVSVLKVMTLVYALIDGIANDAIDGTNGFVENRVVVRAEILQFNQVNIFTVEVRGLKRGSIRHYTFGRSVPPSYSYQGPQ